MIFNKNPEDYEKELELMGGMSKKLLWENTSNLEYKDQTLSIDLSEYDAVELIMEPYDLSDNKSGTLYWINVGETARLLISGAHLQYRDVTVNATGITFGKAYICWNMNGTYDANNAVNRPHQIYGIKGVQ